MNSSGYLSIGTIRKSEKESEKQLEKIKAECDGLPAEFRDSLAYWPVPQVEKVHENLRSATEIVDDLGLIRAAARLK